MQWWKCHWNFVRPDKWLENDKLSLCLKKKERKKRNYLNIEHEDIAL